MALKWYVDGSGYDYHNSDERKKENIKDIENSLDKQKNIRGVSYNFILGNDEIAKLDSVAVSEMPEFEKNNFLEKATKKQIGFLAQNIELTFPECVETDDLGNKFVNYDGIIPVLVEGIKEQQAIIENQHETIGDLEKRVEDLEKEIMKIYQEINKSSINE